MRSIILAALACAAAVPYAPAAEKEEQPDLRLYVIGNSLTDELRYGDFVKMAAGGGKTVRLARLTVPGAPIGWLWGHNLEKGGFVTRPYGNPKHAFAHYRWDAFTMQPFQWRYDKNIVDAPKFMKLLYENSPDAQVYIYAQWPANRGGDWTRRWLMDRTENIMSRQEYEDTVAWLRENVKEGKPVRLIPVGHVMHVLEQKAKAGLVPGITTMWQAYDDGVHVNNLGNLVVCSTYYATLFGVDPTPLPFDMFNSPQDKIAITGDLAAVVRASTWQVVATHRWTGVRIDRAVEVVTPRIDPAVAGGDYTFELLGAFGGGGLRWTVAAGDLPAGMNLSESGVLKGTPAKTGDYIFTARVTGADKTVATREYELGVLPDTAPSLKLPETTAFEQGFHRRVALEAASDNPPLFWTAVDKLPAGLSLTAAGVLAGAAGKAGDYPVTVSVTDGDASEPETAQGKLTIRVTKAARPIAFARHLPKKPRFDGKPDGDPWQFSRRLEKVVAGTPDNTVAFDCGWHERDFYVAVRVTDDAMTGRKWGDDLSDGDHVVIYLDGLNNREKTYNWDDIRLAANPAGNRSGRRFGIDIRSAAIDGGWFAEAKIGLKRVGRRINPKKGNPIDWRSVGLDIMNVDVDAEGAQPTGTLIWHGSAANDSDPSGFRTVIFSPATKNK